MAASTSAAAIAFQKELTKYQEKFDEKDVPTAYWAIPFGVLITCLACVQFGESIYTFVDLQKSPERSKEIYQLSLKQLILTVISIVVGLVGALLWKQEKVSRTILKISGFFCFALFGYSLYIMVMLQRLIEENPVPTNAEEAAFMQRCMNVKFGNLALMVLVFFFGLGMLWAGAFVDV